MNERIDGVPASEYSSLKELQGRVNAALIYIDMSDFVDKDIVRTILSGDHDMKKRLKNNYDIEEGIASEPV